MKIDFIFDFASPNAYLCHKVIPGIENRTGKTFNYIPCLNQNSLWLDFLEDMVKK